MNKDRRLRDNWTHFSLFMIRDVLSEQLVVRQLLK